MIFACNFEEVRALREGARALLDETGGAGPVVAPPEPPYLASELTSGVVPGLGAILGSGLTPGLDAGLESGGEPEPISSAERAAVASLFPQLTGDLSFQTLAEQEAMERGVRAVVAHLRQTMESRIVATHPADEPAVAAYFDYAHALSVLHRMELTGREMHALYELVHGVPAGPVECHTFHFPD